VAVNGGDRDWTRHRWILWFGACAPTLLMVWANDLDAALDEATEWLAEHAPGLLADKEVRERYRGALSEGLLEEAAFADATGDVTCADGHYVNSWEWGVIAQDPTRAEIAALKEAA
jgi:hypothetical protein